MKVSGPAGSNGMAATGGASRRAPSAGGAFSPASTQDASDVAHAGVAAPVGSVDALIALQEVSSPLDRRRRAARRAGRILDVLDEVKMALLEGNASPEALTRLQRSVREERAATDNPGLEGVLDEIDLRAAVELAKQEVARGGG